MLDESLIGPEPLAREHEVDAFDCGNPRLNAYLKTQALRDQQAGKGRTFVVADGLRVVGYFTVAASSIEVEEASSRASKGQGQQPIPAILLARLARDLSVRGRGIGEALLVQALAKAASAADTIGVRAVLVHAVDENARSFYKSYGFEESPLDEMHLMLIMKDVRKTLGI